MRRLVSLPLLVALTVLTVGEGCRRGRVLVAKPSVGRGVTVEASDGARLKGVYATVGLTVVNDTDEILEVNRNQIAVVGPGGREVYRSGGRELTVVQPRSKQGVSLEVEAPDKDLFRDAPGIYLRFDGIYAGTMRVDVPPMAIGSPTWGPGNTNRSFAASGTTPRASGAVAPQPQPAGATTAQTAPKEKPGFFRRMMNAARGKDAEPAPGAPAPAAQGATASTATTQPPPPDTSMQASAGSCARRASSAPPCRCARRT